MATISTLSRLTRDQSGGRLVALYGTAAGLDRRFDAPMRRALLA